MVSHRILNLIHRLGDEAQNNFGVIPMMAQGVASMFYQLHDELLAEAKEENAKFLEGKLPQYLLITSITGHEYDFAVPMCPHYIDKAMTPEYAKLQALLWSINVHVAWQVVNGNPDAEFKLVWEFTNPSGPVVWKVVNEVSKDVYHNSVNVGFTQKLYSMLDTSLGGTAGTNDTVSIERVVGRLDIETLKHGIALLSLPRVSSEQELYKLFAETAGQYARDVNGVEDPKAWSSLPYDQELLGRVRVEFNLPAELGHHLVRISIKSAYRSDWIDPTEERRFRLETHFLYEGFSDVLSMHRKKLVWYYINEHLDQLIEDFKRELGNCLPKEKEKSDEDAGSTDGSE